MLASSFAGVLVDRWNRKRVIMLADAGQALGSLLLMLSFLSGVFQLWHLYAVGLMMGTFAMFQEPAKGASVTMLVPEKHRERANALQAMSHPLAGVIAPALTGVLYVAIGIGGVILIDLLTFLVAVLVVYFIHIPQPEQTDEGRTVAGSLWSEWRGGLAYLGERPALLTLVLFMTTMSFLLNGSLELSIPYVIAITGSEAISGLVLAANSLGGFVGAGILAVWGGTRPRIHTIMVGLLLVGVMFVAYGTARTPLLLALSIFFLLLPLQSWALYISIKQAKTPPDMQGRVFALTGQFGYLGASTSFLVTGLLVDHVLEPAVNTPVWEGVAWLVGRAPGSGMGLLLVGTGIIVILLTLVVYALPRIRHLEAELPDYEAVATTTH
jgi:MFS transporter, DHA3 family, macrolide efflux protein